MNKLREVAFGMTQSNDEKMKLYIPNGFESCHDGSTCPSCNSLLIRKTAVESVKNFDRAHHSATDTDDQMNYALRLAKATNSLLTALSFDACTRNSSIPIKASRVIPGVSYCGECKVHVVVDPDELGLLFPDDGHDEEWLRGSLLVALNDKEVDALLTSRNKSRLSQLHHLCPKQPTDFDYDYRHKVATKTMASKMTRGYTLTEDICNDCEMPLMESDDKLKECVVCPKLCQKIRRSNNFSQGSGCKQIILKADKCLQEDPTDTIAAIIAEARRAAESKEKLAATSPDKNFGSSSAVSISRTESTSLASTLSHDCPPHHQQVLSANDNFIQRPISWDKMLLSGRLLLSKRLSQGWTLSERSCLGIKCKGTPLIREGNNVDDVCMVCGGSGNGYDGYYASEKEKYIAKEEPSFEARLEQGRSLLKRRLEQGWTMTTENCQGYQCNNMPLTKLGSKSISCVVCGGSGSGNDGMYEELRSAEVVDAERELVSQEISHLMSMGWILRDSLCQQCLMPLVSEHEESDDLCILCGNVPRKDFSKLKVSDFSSDEVSNEAGKRLRMGWTLPNAPLCVHCGGLQMMPPNSTEVGCIMPGCVGNTELLQELNALDKNGNDSNVSNDVIELEAESVHEPSSAPFSYVGVPRNDEDPSVLSDGMSQTSSVASSALSDIIARLDNAKYQLKVLSESSKKDPLECTAKQIEIASLIEKLARAC